MQSDIPEERNKSKRKFQVLLDSVPPIWGYIVKVAQVGYISSDVIGQNRRHIPVPCGERGEFFVFTPEPTSGFQKVPESDGKGT